ncbi:hypothetical protein TNCV_1016161 [Trichonephila clavipes]|uniref:Uncharacterized protein n=1 Tax=Trichonephila clavipes TaxID=2585209 RepID=A0A8X7B9W4_TRICX|nr:hypothetical protein TNCV_1016161 [Trichonephila clavipes]
MPGENFWRRLGPTQDCRAIEEEECFCNFCVGVQHATRRYGLWKPSYATACAVEDPPRGARASSQVNWADLENCVEFLWKDMPDNKIIDYGLFEEIR